MVLAPFFVVQRAMPVGGVGGWDLSAIPSLPQFSHFGRASALNVWNNMEFQYVDKI